MGWHDCTAQRRIPLDVVFDRAVTSPVVVAVFLTAARVGTGLGNPGTALRFVLSDGTEVPHDVDHVDAVGGTTLAWVRLPEVGVVPTRVWLYVGTASRPLDRSLTWAGHVAVFHMNDSQDASGRVMGTQCTGMCTFGSGLLGGAVAVQSDGKMLAPRGSAGFVSGALTVSAWVQADQLAAGASVFLNTVVTCGRADNGDSYAYYLNLRGTPAATFTWQVAPGVYPSVQLSVPDVGNGWHHVAAVREAGGTVRLLWDGAVLGVYQGATGEVPGTQCTLAVGGDSEDPGFGWTGRIDEVRVLPEASVDRVAFDVASAKDSVVTYGEPQVYP